MLNTAERDDVLKLIELRGRYDDCQRLLVEQQAENNLLRTNNAALRKLLSQTNADIDNLMIGTHF